MFGRFTAVRKAPNMSEVRKFAATFAVIVLFGGLFCEGAIADGTEKKVAKAADGTADLTWGGLGFGVGIGADFDLRGNRIVDAELDGNKIVRIKDSTSNVNVGLVLEAHYFLRDFILPGSVCAPKVFPLTYSCTEVGHGPFVAIEAGSASTKGTVGGPINSYALGWMVGLHHVPTGANAKPNTTSWNFGIGLRIDPSAKVLGDGIVANQPLVAGDTLRTKQEPRAGIILVSSFSF